METKEYEYLAAKISRRLSSIKAQVDFQLSCYHKNRMFHYNFTESMSYVREYMNDIQAIQEKLNKGF